ncbi:MAG: hypothetical protein QNJ72_29870 [Pleurocapsa sp. MO_226.B13]|nr:hypothetical protein [Pleurocapsa sp. MO_226.B13]
MSVNFTVCFLSFSPDGCTLASASYDQTIRLWEIDNFTCIRVLHTHSPGAQSVCFNPLGNILANTDKDSGHTFPDKEKGQASIVTS